MTLNLVGRSFGRYHLLALLGRGGMAVVYRAHDPVLDRHVAIKVIKPELASHPPVVERFRREARAMASLDHPHLVQIYEVGETDGLPYISMELLAGRTLADQIAHAGAQRPQWVARMIAEIGEAIDLAHSKGLIHRDIKPNNIMIGPGGHATLMDFGLVKAAQMADITTDGVPIGAPAYMSPEQASGDKVTKATDIYSLGVVAYEALTGQTPFRSETPAALLYAHINRTPPPMRQVQRGVPLLAERAVMRAMAKQPDRRWPSASAFARELATAVDGSARPSGVPWPLIAGGALALLLVIGLVFAIKSGNSVNGGTIAPISTTPDGASSAGAAAPEPTIGPTDTPPADFEVPTATVQSEGAQPPASTTSMPLPPIAQHRVALLEPGDKLKLDRTVKFVWQPMIGAVKYDLRACEGERCEPSLGKWVGEQTHTDWCPGTAKFAPGAIVHWRVAALDAAGQSIPGSESAVRSFYWVGGCPERTDDKSSSGGGFVQLTPDR